MCGILAVFCTQIPKDLKKIMSSGKLLESRGPDKYTSIVKSTGVYLFRRLAINDLSVLGDQPFVKGNKLLMCNGEIYNHKALEEEFSIKCESKSDCEVILHLYEKIGFAETVKRLDGIFAIVLVDGDKMFIARDRIGVRPLFYGVTSDNYLAVSSLPMSLQDFCLSIDEFPPGMSAMHDKKNDDQLFIVLGQDKMVIPDKRNYDGVECVRKALYAAVKKRLISDRPIGCFLSGGLDSSIVASILVELIGAENVRTYSIGMEGSTDLHYARIVADFLHTKHTEVRFTPEEGLAVIPEVIRQLGSYDITTVRASVGMYLLSKYVSQHTKDRVIFSGEGSDELFGGYLYFHAAPTPNDGERECLRLMNELHRYDVLRADRCISSNGLELREPFLDRAVVDLALSLPAEEKVPQKGYEKYILRQSFSGLLPEEILLRQKCAFSDGVSSVKRSWFQYIQDYAETKISNEIFNRKYPSKEAMYYRLVYEHFYANYDTETPYWMPKWCGASDPSARTLKICTETDVVSSIRLPASTAKLETQPASVLEPEQTIPDHHVPVLPVVFEEPVQQERDDDPLPDFLEAIDAELLVE